MKIATYNIASGGFSSYQSQANQPERLDLLVQAIKQINADFISLIDTYCWSEIYSNQDLKNLFGYSYNYQINLADPRLDERMGLAILSHSPLESPQPVKLHNRQGLKTSLETEGQSINLITVYLDDLCEETRLLEIQNLF